MYSLCRICAGGAQSSARGEVETGGSSAGMRGGSRLYLSPLLAAGHGPRTHTRPRDRRQGATGRPHRSGI